MTQTTPAPRLARFESFDVDLRTGELRNNGEKVKLPEQSFKILAMLIGKPGEVVMRAEIQKRLWPNDTVVEFENSINAAVKNLRLALGDSADQPRYVETLARRGYRWLVPVNWIDENSLKQPQAAMDNAEVAAPAAYLLGKKVSHYRVLEILGGGGMGVVYKAEDIKLCRRVALKFLPVEMANDPAAMERFKREARAASALNHPNICTIYSVDEYDGQPFIAMELLEGQTVRELLDISDSGREVARKGALPLDKLLDIGIQIGEALNAAHSKGIIHRDIKPANVFVTNSGQAKILDFGLAKSLELEAPDLAPTGAAQVQPAANLNLTRTGTTIGTAGYMSPEQVRGEKVDTRTDLFSFGLVLYEMSVGRRAFSGETAPILHTAILNETPTPVRQLNPRVPPKLEAIINKALEKDRAKRYQTATEIAAALENLTGGVASKRRVMLWLVAAAVIAIFVIVVRFWPLNWQPQTTPELKLTQLTFNSSQNPVGGGAISPDGTYLAYNDLQGVHVKRIGSDSKVSFPQPEELKNKDITWEILTPGWFPDNARFLANVHPKSETLGQWSSRTSSIWVFNVDGGSPRKVRDNAVGFSVSPDGSMISFGQNPNSDVVMVGPDPEQFGEREIWVMSASGANAYKLYEAEGNSGLWGLIFLPNAQRTTYTITNESGDTVVTRDLRGGPVSKVFGPDQNKKIGNPVWLPDGRMIYADACDTVKMRPDSPCNLWITRIDALSGRTLERPKQITNWVGQAMNIPSATSDGKRVAILRYLFRSTGYLADIADDGTRLLNSRLFTPDEGGEDTVVDWTSDSKSIILDLNRADHTTFQKQPLNGTSNETIASMDGLGEFESVSPDGRWIIALLWSAAWDNGQTLHLVRIPLGGGTPELIFTLPEFTSSFYCARPPSNLCAIGEQTPDYKQAIITRFDPIKGRGAELARFDLSPEYQTKRMQVRWNISNDGTKLAFAAGPQGPIHVRSLQSGRQQIVRAKGLLKNKGLEWAHSGKGFFMFTQTKDGNEILYANLQGETKVVWNCGYDDCWGRESPDGHQFAINVGKFNSNLWMIENF